MGKAPRSPLLGYNHNISHLGRVFHVQTEDSGPLTPRLFTHMFHEGTILASVKHEYDVTTPDDQVRLLMQNQHKAMIRDLLRAKFDDKLVLFFRARGEELLAAAGALPSTPMPETPPPVLAEERAAAGSPGGPTAPAEETPLDSATTAPAEGDALGAAPPPRDPRDALSSTLPGRPGESEGSAARLEVDSSVPLPIEGQRETRPLVSPSPRGGAGRVTETRRSPFVRNVGTNGGAAGVAKTAKVASTEGVVMQRTVRVGAPPAARAPRARATGPFARVSPQGGEPGGGADSRGQRRGELTLSHRIVGGDAVPSAEKPAASAAAPSGEGGEAAAPTAPDMKADSDDDGLA